MIEIAANLPLFYMLSGCGLLCFCFGYCLHKKVSN